MISPLLHPVTTTNVNNAIAAAFPTGGTLSPSPSPSSVFFLRFRSYYLSSLFSLRSAIDVLSNPDYCFCISYSPPLPLYPVFTPQGISVVHIYIYIFPSHLISSHLISSLLFSSLRFFSNFLLSPRYLYYLFFFFFDLI